MIKKLILLLYKILQKPTLINFVLKVLPIFSRRNHFFISYILVSLTIRKLNNNVNPNSRILIIEKAIFTDDIIESIGRFDDFEIYGIPRAIIKCLAIPHLLKANRADDTYIYDTKKGKIGKKNYRDFLKKMWLYLHNKYHFKALITGNWAYWAERELPFATKLTKTYFIVMHKEGIKPPGRSEFLKKHFFVTRGQYNGDYIFVYQNAEKNHQIEGMISKPKQIKVCGMPRLDAVHRWRKSKANIATQMLNLKPTILVLPILENNFLPIYSGIDDGKRWKNLSFGLINSVMKFALQREDVSIILRPRSYEIEDIKILLKKFSLSLPKNIKINSDGNVHEEIYKSWCVVGHNTTVLLEALAAGKIVIEPNFGEAKLPEYKPYIVDLEGATIKADSEDLLIDLMDKYSSIKPKIMLNLSEDVKKQLDYWTGNSDGCSGLRICRELKKIGI